MAGVSGRHHVNVTSERKRVQFVPLRRGGRNHLAEPREPHGVAGVSCQAYLDGKGLLDGRPVY